MRIALYHVRIVLPGSVLPDSAVLIEDGLIHAVDPLYTEGKHNINLHGATLLPGFVHISISAGHRTYDDRTAGVSTTAKEIRRSPGSARPTQPAAVALAAVEHGITSSFAASSGLSEMPANLAAARAAREGGASLALPASALLDETRLGDMLAGDAIRLGLCDIVHSAGDPAAMLSALFATERLLMGDLAAAAELFTRNPAAAAAMSDRGEIVPGLRADLVVVERSRSRPVVQMTWLAGRCVFTATGADAGSFSLSPVLRGEGRGEGPGVEHRDSQANSPRRSAPHPDPLP